MADKYLVIVESPAKARTINRYLGRQYVVKSSVGHIRDLPTSGGRAKKTGSKKPTNRLAVDPDNNWQAHYEILPGKDKILKELKKLASSTNGVYLATDLDREGEAIAWHLREAIGGSDEQYKRVIFSEITHRAIRAAFDHPQEINMDRVNAQQARRFLDRVVGYMVSPLLWKKIARGLSAGRVQSVAVKLVALQEKEINAFKIEEFWEVFCLLKNSEQVKAQVVREHAKPFRPPTKEDCDVKVAALRQREFVVSACEKKPTQSKPPAPLITSTLQQAASTRLGFGVKKTMVFAQRLYEAGHITYMRTDSTNVSKDAVTSCRHYVQKNFAPEYLPAEPNVFASRKDAQEAHEAIRPTDVEVIPEKFFFPERDAVKLYDLIWRYFVASQMSKTLFDTTVIILTAGEFELKLRGRILRFAGFQKVLPPLNRKDEADIVVPDLKVGEKLQLVDVEAMQRFTKPPPRYSEASLVKELEKIGIGRPSTYATIISTIQERGYVKVEKRRFYLLKMGDIVTNRLEENFKNLMDFGFTADMEEKLDAIAGGKIKWLQVLNQFYANFKQTLEAAEENMRPNLPTEVNIKCPKCGRNMAVRSASTGVFLGCLGYQLPPKERCKETVDLIPGDEIISDEEEVKELQARKRCAACRTAMTSYLIDEQRRLHICGNHPDCASYEIERGQFKIKGYDGPVIACDKCNSDMQLKTGRFGKYFACTAYPDCKNTRKLLKNGEPAPPRAAPVPMPELKCEKSDGHFVLRDGAAGIFLASSNYPKSRETRAPLVEDLLRHADELDPKFAFLTQAPPVDSAGNKTIVKFSRKTRSYYLTSICDGKPSSWSATWQDGRWQEAKE